jgi:hypothetical protein
MDRIDLVVISTIHAYHENNVMPEILRLRHLARSLWYVNGMKTLLSTKLDARTTKAVEHAGKACPRNEPGPLHIAPVYAVIMDEPQKCYFPICPPKSTGDVLDLHNVHVSFETYLRWRARETRTWGSLSSASARVQQVRLYAVLCGGVGELRKARGEKLTRGHSFALLLSRQRQRCRVKRSLVLRRRACRC